MARIKVLEAIAGADFSWAPGDFVDLPDEQARGWADGHRAILVFEGQHRIQDLVYEAGGLVTPRVVTAAGLELDVLAAEFEDAEPAEGVDGGCQRLKVTVAPPAPADVVETEAPKVFDPSEHKVDEVLAHLAEASEEEAVRVLNAEAAAKKPRASIVNQRDDLLAAARERAATPQQTAEKAADISRGGGRADEYEIRSE